MKNWMNEESLALAKANAEIIVTKAGELNGWDCIDYPVAETLLALLEARAAVTADPRVQELEAAVKAGLELVDWFMTHSRAAAYDHEEGGVPLHETKGWNALTDAGYDGIIASYRAQFREALAGSAAQTATEPQEAV